jgi:hypothetical protein
VHGDELCESAGLEEAWDEKGVRSAVDPVRPLFVIHDAGTDASAEGVFIIAEGILIPCVTGPQNDDLGVPVNQFGKNEVDKIKAFLICQAGDQADNELLLINLQAKRLLKRSFVFRLLRQHIRKVIIRSEQSVGGAVPLFRVNAVDNATKLRSMVTKMRIQPFPEERRLNFIGVRVAYSGDHIRIGKTALEEICIPVIL